MQEETHLISVYRYFPRCILQSSSFILIENSNIHDYLNKPDRVSESHRLCATDPGCVSASKLRNLALPRTGSGRQGQTGSKLSCLSRAHGESTSASSFPMGSHHEYTYIYRPDQYMSVGIHTYTVLEGEREREGVRLR